MAWGNPMSARWGRLYKGTEAEIALEEAVAEIGVPYRNQFPGYIHGFRFFPDFLLPTLGLVIEVDDKSHRRGDKQLADEERTAYLRDNFGWRVVRCTNEEALTDPRGAVRRMLTSAGCWPLPARLPSLASSLPAPKKCPQKARRESVAEARKLSRNRRRK